MAPTASDDTPPSDVTPQSGEVAFEDSGPALPAREVSDVERLELVEQQRRLLAKMFDIEREPTRLAHYRLRERIAHGSTGVVYAAFDEQLERKVAIKLLAAQDCETSRERFWREARAMGRLTHPNVVQIYEIGEAEGLTFIVMEYVRGGTLRDWLDAETRTPAQVLRAFTDAGEGLLAAHRGGLVHRDVKPQNLLVDSAGRVRVTDFGFARQLQAGLGPTDEMRAQPGRLTTQGALMGTPGYMAPEQFEGSEADARSDQFGFCVALWEALYGQRPFAGETMLELACAVMNGEIEPSRSRVVPRRLRAVLLRGLAVNPDARWPTMAELLVALRRAQQSRATWWPLALVLLAMALLLWVALL